MARFRLLSRLRLLLRREDGAVLVEFALILPLMLLVFAVMLESGRMLWSYQQTISAVRDASRYLGRAAPYETCPGFTEPTEPMLTNLTNIVQDDIAGISLFASGITIDSVTYEVACLIEDATPAGFADPNVMIGTVTATLEITFPLGRIFALFGPGLGSVTTTVQDQVRIYGQ
jgi:hypothetical protein